MLQREEGLHREVSSQRVYSPHVVEKANELANVERSIYEHRDLLKQICSYHHRPRRDPHAAACPKCAAEGLSECEKLLEKYDKLSSPFSCGDMGDGTEEGQNGANNEEDDEGVKRKPSYTPQLIKAKSAKCFDKRLKNLQELCDDTFYKATVELLKETERGFRGDLSYLHTRRLDRDLRQNQSITNFLFEDDFGECDAPAGGSLRPFCAVNHAVDNCALPSLPPIIVGPVPPNLDGCNPLQSLNPASVNNHNQLMREPESVESQLDLSSSDQTLETQESSEETKGSFSSDKSRAGQTEKERDTTSATSDAPDSDLTPDPNTDLERESSSEELETTAGEDEDDHTPVSLLEVISELEASKEDDCDETADGACDLESDLLVPIDPTCCITQEGFLYEASAPDTLSHPDQASPTQPFEATVVNQEPQALLPLPDHYGVAFTRSESSTDGLDLNLGLHGDGVSHTSAEDGSDCTMSASAGSDRAASPLGYGGLVTPRKKKKAGQGALKFVRQYPFAMQALWCLLSGRTLVVFGADEGRVRRLVSALALFVPAAGKCGERVQAWLSCPFTLTDLQRWKLIGLQRYVLNVSCCPQRYIPQFHIALRKI